MAGETCEQRFKCGMKVKNIRQGSARYGKTGTVVCIIGGVIYVDYGNNQIGCCHDDFDSCYELIQKEITKMKRLNNFIKKVVDVDTQELLKAGYINGDLEPTGEGLRALNEVLWFANLPAIVAAAKERNVELEAEEKQG